MTDSQEIKKSKNGAYIAVIIILILLLGGMSYMWSSKNGELDDCINENKKLTADMNGMNEMLGGYVDNMSNDLKTDFQNMLSTYDALLEKDRTQADSINAQKAKIEELLSQVKRGKMTAHQLFLMRKENETLRKIMKGYVVQIDSLNTLNLQLTSNLESKTTELASTIEQRDQFKQEAREKGELVEKASKLQAYNFDSGALKVALGGGMKPTTRARGARQIKSSFTLSENEIIPAQSLAVYMQIVAPDGKTLQKRTTDVIQTSSGTVPYSDQQPGVDYENKRTDVTIYYDLNGTSLEKGNYKVRIYCLGHLIGTDSFTLK